jgi:hypothetical protein
MKAWWKAAPGWLLCACALPVMAQQQAPQTGYAAEFQRLTAAYQQAEQKFYEPYSRAKTDAEREKIHLDWKKHPAGTYLPKFQALARRARGTDTGAKALMQVIQLSQMARTPQAAQEALNELTGTYLRSPALGETAQMLLYSDIPPDRAEAALQKIADGSPHHSVQAAALFTLGARKVQWRQPTPAERAAARKLFDRVKREYAGTPYAKRAESFVFELENLQIGMTAPDFEATDPDGKTFKLSDYRGKVVVLDFWGFW